MEVVIGSKHHAVDFASALDTTGREHLIIVAKAAWQIPGEGQRPCPMPPPELVHADVYVGAPGESAMLYGADFVRFKPRCDVLFNASAHAPGGKPVKELVAAWQVGPLKKGLKVHGPRTWRKRLMLTSMGEAEPFTTMPLHYGMAFGGTRTYTKGKGDAAQTLTEVLIDNPAGIGWVGPHTDDGIDGMPAPSLEGLNDPISKPGGKHIPIAFSAVGAHWVPRKDFAGTYDQYWQENVFPLLPADFDEQYHQCAPMDQQMPYPVGGEDVILRNMMAGREFVQFKLPRLNEVYVQIVDADFGVQELQPVVDTVYFEPDQNRFSVVWRTSLPLKRGIHGVRGIKFGTGRPGRLDELMDRINSCAGCSTELVA